MSRSFKLFRLQQLDTQLDSIENRLKEIETALKDDQMLQEARAQASQSEQQWQQAHRSLRRLEDEVAQQRIKIEQSEASLYGGKIRNPKELRDLENEVAALKRYLSVLEDRQLEAMLQEEEAAQQKERAFSNLAETQQRFEQRCRELERERESLLREKANLIEERSATLTSIIPEDQALYLQLRQTRRGIAVAKVSAKACSACGSILSASLLSAAHSPNEVHRCATCGRILYVG